MKKIILSIIIVCTTITSHAQSIEPFKEGNRIVFLGNSITDGGHYHSYIWLYYMTRFPNMPITIFNGGIGGDTAYDMYKRLDGDIFSKNPSVLMVTFGMNDSGYYEYNGDNASEFAETKYQECIDNYKLIEKRLLSLPSTRIIMAGTSPYDEIAEIEGNTVFKKKNETIKKIIGYQIESAKKNKWEYIDWNAPMLAINREHQKENPKFTLCGKDRIHPDNDGHMVMAYLFLKAQGFAGQCVADIEINAMKKSAEKTVNCEITDIKKTGKELSFHYLPESLPYPLDTIARGWGSTRSQAKAAEYVPFMQEMNSETLRIHGLQGQYKLLIDNEEIGIWSGEDLNKGINLAAETKTPQYQQALAIMHLNERRWEIERLFREYAWCQFGFFQQQGLLDANNRKAIEIMDNNVNNNALLKNRRDTYTKMMHQPVREAMNKEMNALISTIYEINKPVKRKIVVRKIN